MAKAALTAIKNWFLTGSKPTQTQFHNWMDSFWHKDEKIPISSVTDLGGILNNLQSNINSIPFVDLTQPDSLSLKEFLDISAVEGGSFAPAGTQPPILNFINEGKTVICIKSTDGLFVAHSLLIVNKTGNEYTEWLFANAIIDPRNDNNPIIITPTDNGLPTGNRIKSSLLKRDGKQHQLSQNTNIIWDGWMYEIKGDENQYEKIKALWDWVDKGLSANTDGLDLEEWINWVSSNIGNSGGGDFPQFFTGTYESHNTYEPVIIDELVQFGSFTIQGYYQIEKEVFGAKGEVVFLYNADLNKGDLRQTLVTPTKLMTRVFSQFDLLNIPSFTEKTYAFTDDLGGGTVNWDEILNKPAIITQQTGSITVTKTATELQTYLDSLPKYLDGNVSITVTGTNSSTIDIDGFYGKGALNITSINRNNICKELNINNCGCNVNFENIGFGETCNIISCIGVQFSDVNANICNIDRSIVSFHKSTLNNVHSSRMGLVEIGNGCVVNRLKVMQGGVVCIGEAVTSVDNIGTDGSGMIIDGRAGNFSGTFASKDTIEIINVDSSLTLTPDHYGKTLRCAGNSNIVLTVPQSSVRGAKILINRGNQEYDVSFAYSAPVIVDVPEGLDCKIIKNGFAGLICRGGNNWNLFGDLELIEN